MGSIREPATLPCMATHMDGAHCGLADWYPEIEKGIAAALKRGKKVAWTTGWYASKKEIASARITHIGGSITVEVSVSDDFDTIGNGERTIRHTTNLEKIRQAIYAAWEEAETNQRDNRLYAGFKVLHESRWVETLLIPCGDGHMLDRPPGEYYHQWGFQGDGARIAKATKEKLCAWATENDEGEFTYKGYTIKPWE